MIKSAVLEMMSWYTWCLPVCRKYKLGLLTVHDLPELLSYEIFVSQCLQWLDMH